MCGLNKGLNCVCARVRTAEVFVRGGINLPYRMVHLTPQSSWQSCKMCTRRASSVLTTEQAQRARDDELSSAVLRQDRSL